MADDANRIRRGPYHRPPRNHSSAAPPLFPFAGDPSPTGLHLRHFHAPDVLSGSLSRLVAGNGGQLLLHESLPRVLGGHPFGEGSRADGADGSRTDRAV